VALVLTGFCNRANIQGRCASLAPRAHLQVAAPPDSRRWQVTHVQGRHLTEGFSEVLTGMPSTLERGIPFLLFISRRACLA